MRFLVDFRNVMIGGVVWGFLAYVFYGFLMGFMPLPIGLFVAFTVLFPGMFGHVVVANTFRSSVVVGGYPFYVYVPNPFTETLGALISMFIGLAVAYVFWFVVYTMRRQN